MRAGEHVLVPCDRPGRPSPRSREVPPPTAPGDGAPSRLKQASQQPPMFLLSLGFSLSSSLNFCHGQPSQHPTRHLRSPLRRPRAPPPRSIHRATGITPEQPDPQPPASSVVGRAASRREGCGHGTQSAAHRSRCRKPLRRPRAPPPRSVRSTRRRLLHRLSSGGGHPRVVPVRPPRGLAQPSSPAKAVEHLVFLPYRGSTTLPRPAPPLSPPPPPAPPLFSPSSFRITERSHRIAANGKEQHGRGVESGTQAWSLST